MHLSFKIVRPTPSRASKLYGQSQISKYTLLIKQIEERCACTYVLRNTKKCEPSDGDLSSFLFFYILYDEIPNLDYGLFLYYYI